MPDSQPIKLMIVDDSSAYRKILHAVISRDPEIKVVGLAEDGFDCIQKIPEVKPDIITLDIEMPKMNGIETLKILREKYSSIPVIMLSSLTDTGAQETIQCLSLGACDFIPKVLDVSSIDKNINFIKNNVVSKIKLQYKNKIFYDKIASNSLTSSSVSDIVSVPSDINLIVFGIGAGGYQALIQIMSKVEKSAKIPIVALCHMNTVYLKNLVEELKKTVKPPMKIVEDAFPLFPRFIYLASADQVVEIVNNDGKSMIEVAKLDGLLDMESHQPINKLFASVGKLENTKAMVILLKFSGGDGMDEMRKLRALGHFTVIQDSEMLGVGESEYANIRVPVNQMHSIINQLNKA